MGQYHKIKCPTCNTSVETDILLMECPVCKAEWSGTTLAQQGGGTGIQWPTSNT